MKTGPLFLTLSFLLILTISGHSTPLSADTRATVNVVLPGGQTDSHSDGASWSSVPGDLSFNTSASAIDGNGNAGFAFGKGNATWASDGNSGTINMTFGWSSSGPSGARLLETTLVPGFNGVEGPLNWTYTFTADASGSFVMNYKIVGNGSFLFGLKGFDLLSDLDSVSNPPKSDGHDFDPTSSGTFVGGVTEGKTYTVSLENRGNIFNSSGIGNIGLEHFQLVLAL
jgi:hypothetical protein